MLDANDTEYYDVQGTMLIDPAISPDVALVESKHSGFPDFSITCCLISPVRGFFFVELWPSFAVKDPLA